MGNKEPSLRVFVSSTAADLEEHRDAVLRAIRRMDWHPVAMEDFGGRPRGPVDVCLGDIRGCEALVVVVAHRYGWVPAKEQGGDGSKSITWLEVQEALHLGIPVFAFLIDSRHPWTHDREESGLWTAETEEQVLEIHRRVRALRELRAFLEAGAGIVQDTFTTADNLAGRVATSLSRWRAEQQREARSATEKESTPVPKERSPGLETAVTRYLRSAEAAYEHIALAGFETKVRVPIRLEEMYVPLEALVDQRRFGDGCFGDAAEAEDRLRPHATEDGQVPLTEAFQRADELGGRRGLVILGDPGSGKTTHLKRLLLWLIRQGPETVGLPAGMVPVFLPLRNLRDLDSGLDAFIEDELASPHLRLEEGFGRRLLERGNLLLLFDGLDEVADSEDRTKVSRWIEGAMAAHPDSRFVVTCRYAGYTLSLIHI